MSQQLHKLTTTTYPYYKFQIPVPSPPLSPPSQTCFFSCYYYFLITYNSLLSLPTFHSPPSMGAKPKGTILFSTVGRTDYGFDIFSLQLHRPQLGPERRLTDAHSINFNGQFILDDHDSHGTSPTLLFVSERTGSPRIYLTRPGLSHPKLLPFVPESLFHDRPILNNDTLYFVSAHQKPHQIFSSWSALYSTPLNATEITRLTPRGSVDYSPALSASGKFLAVASYGSRPWGGEFHELNTDIVVFDVSDPVQRVVVCERGGWPSWSADTAIYFHHQAGDGWWSIFRLDFPGNLEADHQFPIAPIRVTPPGVHCFTPAAAQDGKTIAVATRRRGSKFRHIELFDVESMTFHPVTEKLNPNTHHYNPFVSPDSQFLGYHRFRGHSTDGVNKIPHLEPVTSAVEELRMLRVNGSFPSVSPNGDLIAINPDFEDNARLKIVKSDGSKRWSLLKGRVAFYNSWSPAEEHVIYTSLGPIFESVKATVQIARITFDPKDIDGDGEDDIPCDVKFLTREDTGNNAFPSCSPDGKSLVFRSGRSGHKNLYILDAVNGEFDGGIRQLTDGPWIDTMPSWSPKGDLIAFSSNRHKRDDASVFSIYVIRPDGSGLKRIYVAGPEGSDEVDRERINHVCFSGDGEWLLFTANLGGVTAEPVSWPNQFQPYGDLFVARLDGSELRRLTWSGFENGTPTWISGVDLDIGRLSLGDDEVGDELRGQFEEPLWITTDI
ncbi:Tricorn protease [Trema orientale]|uniref:Tricorn protease n=1 Tax=Trema orientale TaxID=63057 RepID=A0A2P5ET86_TREOI|nr:Tricorn protease [Trema orientale]